MNTLSRFLFTVLALSSVNVMAEPQLRLLNNEEAAALLSTPATHRSNNISPCNAILSSSQGMAKRSAEQIRCTIDRHGESLNNIYQRALQHNPNLEGSVVFNLVVEPNGIVTSAEPIQSTIVNDVFIQRLRSELMAMKFPDEKVEKWSGTHTLNFMSGY